MIKARYDMEALSVKLGILFSKFGLSPNTWTLLALLPALAGFYSLVAGELPAALGLFILAGILDAVDGAVARVTHSVSPLGAFLDGVIDRYVEFLLYMGLAVYTWNTRLLVPAPLWVIALLYGAVMPSFIRAYADHRKVVTEPEDQQEMGGLIERFERLTLLYIGMLLGVINIDWLVQVIAGLAVLTNLTALQRIRYVVRQKHP